MNRHDMPSLRFVAAATPTHCLTDEALVRLLRDPNAASDSTLRHTLTCEKCMRRVAEVRRVQSVLASGAVAAAAGGAAATVFEQHLFSAVWLPVIKLIGKGICVLAVSTASIVYVGRALSGTPRASIPAPPAQVEAAPAPLIAPQSSPTTPVRSSESIHAVPAAQPSRGQT